MSEAWHVLWDRAMIALDSAETFLGSKPSWSFGGGTAMRLFYDHRESHDIDIFVRDAYVISGLSPRLNASTETLTSVYTEMSNYLKLRFVEGEVDFNIAVPLTTDPFVEMDVRGRRVLVERPIEIVAKKCFYRADQFAARDIFDLAVLIEREPQAVRDSRAVLLGNGEALARRFSHIADAGSPARTNVQRAIDAIDATSAFEATKVTAIDTIVRFLAETA